MMAKNGTEHLLTNKSYIFEMKLDGIRALCCKGKKLKFLSRNGLNITKNYPEFDFYDSIKTTECILDGEIVVFDKKGNPQFQLWQERNKQEGDIPAHLQCHYIVFDVLFLDGKSLLDTPLIKRKGVLNKLIAENDTLQTSFFTEKGKKLWKIAEKRDLEGVIAKKKDSGYNLGSRSDEWMKIKRFKTIDCVVVGYTQEKRMLTSLLLGLHEDGKLFFSGKVGTGFDEAMMKTLLGKLKKMDTTLELPKEAIPVKPQLVVEIKYSEITKDKKLRAPVFVRVRKDKKVEECVLE